MTLTANRVLVAADAERSEAVPRVSRIVPALQYAARGGIGVNSSAKSRLDSTRTSENRIGQLAPDSHWTRHKLFLRPAMAAQSSSQLLNGQLAALVAPLSDDSLHALALLVGPAMLLEALDLIDKDQGTRCSCLALPCLRSAPKSLGMLRLVLPKKVARIMPPNGRPLYQVASSSGGPPYTVFPHVPAGTGYCPCPAYSFGVLAKGNQITVTTPTLALCSRPP